MKRPHRAVHRLAWILLVPALAALLVVANNARLADETPANASLPGDVTAGELP
ncbi:MAG: hypothetical protein AAFZ58_09235 [Pseudomonadota bacterium]